jgi:hypothetical protein
MPSDYERGFDRRATTDEACLPPDKRPWTEYDKDGHKQVTLHCFAHAATPPLPRTQLPCIVTTTDGPTQTARV